MDKFVFRKQKILGTIVFILLMAIWLIYSFKANIILSIIIILILILILNSSIEEIHFKADQISIKNIYKIWFHASDTEILFFGKGLGNSIIYLVILKNKIFPLFFQSRGEIFENVPELLAKLEEVTKKKRGVIFKREERK